MDDPDPAGNLIFQLVLLFALILINAFFAMSEIAIISLNDNKIRKMAEEGHKKAQKVLKLTENSSKFLSTIQIGVTLAGFLTSASASQTLASRLSGWLVSMVPSLPIGLINGIAVVVITILMSYFSLVLGELGPKRIAMQAAEKVSFAVVGPLLVISRISAPFIWILTKSTNFVVRLLGFDPNASEENVTEEEIRMMVDVGKEKGVIEESQKEMINNIFEFDDATARDIMTHRTDIGAVEVTDSVEDAIKLSVEEGYSRIPVFEDDLDDIVGILYVKDLLPYVGENLPDGKTLTSIMRKANFVPETKKCGELFTEMTEKHIQLAVVVDEYGGTAGIVTIEDLIEFIVGNIQDEYDKEEEEVSQINESTFTIDGIMDIDEVAEILGVRFPEGEYDTLGGFLISLLGYLPMGDGVIDPITLQYENIVFTILSAEDKRIGKIRVELLPATDTEETKTEGKEE